MDNSSPKIYTEFLPISRADMEARGWEQLDFVVVGGDAYVDHPSFGTAIISRLLEAEGYKIGVLAQPRYTDCEDFKRFGKPKYGFFIGGGNVDSMVSHYSVAKIPRAEDEYSPGGKGGARPDRSATVYTRLAKQAYPDLPVILGGLEASLRRFAHYDYWLDTVLPSIAEDSGADIISFGMGEHQTVEIARRLAAGEPVESITDVDGTCYMTDFDHLPERYVECAGFKKVASDKTAYAKACRIQMDNQDVVSGQIIVQKQSEKYLVQNIPAKPLVRGELDKVYALPYTRRYHPIYESMGGVPAIREVQFSIIQNRGCFGGCNFCAIQLHQGRRVTSRSADSIVAEAEQNDTAVSLQKQEKPTDDAELSQKSNHQQPPVQMTLFDLWGMEEENRQAVHSTKKKAEVTVGAAAKKVSRKKASPLVKSVNPTFEVVTKPVEKEEKPSLTEAKEQETAQETKPILPGDEPYASISWEENPPINGFYEMMMTMAPEDRGHG